MDLKIRNVINNLIFNITLFLFLIICIQNSLNKTRVDLILEETVELPISFIVGMSFITGSIFGNIIQLNLYKKNN